SGQRDVPVGGDAVNEQIATDLSSDARPPMPDADPDAELTAEPVAQSARPTGPPKGARRQTGHRGAQDPTHDDEMPITRKRRRVMLVTDSGRLPALRLNRYVGRERAERKPTVVYDTQHTPGYLRLTRLLLALALLTMAWATALIVVELGDSLLDVFPHQPSLTLRFGLYVLGALGICWLAVVALALIIVGAFSLTLVLTRRAW
ncbi:MAG TPA: hypothetical protein VID72_12080, partial [Ktedonobacterales bacterium]